MNAIFVSSVQCAPLPKAAPATSHYSIAAPKTQTCVVRAASPCLIGTSRPGRRAPALAARLATVCSAATSTSYADAPAIPLTTTEGEPTQLPVASGVYAVLDASGALQYVGLSRKIAISVATHKDALPDRVHAVKVLELPDAGKDELTAAWRQWVEEAVEATGAIPPGNAPGESAWQQRRQRAAKPELRLTPGKGLEDLTCPLADLVDAVVKSNRVVAFVKGTRTAPQCGFSHKVLTLLAEVAGQEFEVVNVLDEIYNPGLRQAIKDYSQWPTIPQVYVGGEFVGGADIVEQMHGSGELRALVASADAVARG